VRANAQASPGAGVYARFIAGLALLVQWRRRIADGGLRFRDIALAVQARQLGLGGMPGADRGAQFVQHGQSFVALAADVGQVLPQLIALGGHAGELLLSHRPCLVDDAAAIFEHQSPVGGSSPCRLKNRSSIPNRCSSASIRPSRNARALS